MRLPAILIFLATISGFALAANLIIIPRGSWHPSPPSGNNNIMTLREKINKVHLYVTGTQPCTSPENCRSAVKRLQNASQQKGLPDIEYNFLIGMQDGNAVIEGVGWRKMAHRHDHNENESYGIAFIGNYNNSTRNPIPFKMLQAYNNLIDAGLSGEHLQRPLNEIKHYT